MRKIALSVCLAALLAQTACGTIIYPERKGQKDGKIDPGIAVLDGIGLLFFLIPGVIAYAVDFSTGAIYLPGGKRADVTLPTDTNGMVARHVGKENLTDEKIQAIIEAETGKHVDVKDAKVFNKYGEEVGVM